MPNQRQQQALSVSVAVEIGSWLIIPYPVKCPRSTVARLSTHTRDIFMLSEVGESRFPKRSAC